MKKIKSCFLIYSLLYATISFCAPSHTFFSQVIIWGHPLHSHTHSYIHYGFYRAFKHMGYKVYWVDSLHQLNDINLQNSLFLTEGQVDTDIPKRNDCFYILHNCNYHDYKELFDNKRCIVMQVYTHDCLPYAPEKLDEYIYCNTQAKAIFMPWATDLLPYEIESNKFLCTRNKKAPFVEWVGTIGEANFWNKKEIDDFIRACNENNIQFDQTMLVSMDRTIGLIAASYMAPAIQGAWQCEKGYIPCRIFKNISYGQWGITNNQTVYDLFKHKIIYNQDTYQLFYDAKAYIEQAPREELYALMDYVKNNHTYINRIETLLTFMEKALEVSY